MAAVDDQDQEQRRIYVRRFTDFLESDFGHGAYGERVRRMLTRQTRRLVVAVGELRQFDRALCAALLARPADLMPAFEEALRQFVAAVRADDGGGKAAERERFFVALDGAFGRHRVSPRELSAALVRQVVCVEGIVTKCSLIRPKVVQSVHYCEATRAVSARSYRDATDGGVPTPTVYPTRDAENNPLTTEYGLCTYKDHQLVTIQEMPERSPAGQLPCSIDVILENDLVDVCKPGDRVQVMGAYKALPAKRGTVTKGVFRTVLLANNVKQIATEVIGPVITAADIKNIRTVAADPHVFELLAQSIAPSIYGHEYMKRAILLQLLGGCEKNLDNGTHIRGDINILMVGDPSTAKSQLLRYVLNIAPLAVSTSGRGSSGVGLTAAVTSDAETGERRLEAGAMVLADRGIVAIDEFDKMSVDDRVAIHEVMEQQTVTIAKAGIHCSLNARCSVVAAANPVYGQYNRQKRPNENIGLPDSLLSRFDLLFIVLDNLTPQHDRRIADHVLRMHRYRRPGDADGTPLTADDFDRNAQAAAATRGGTDDDVFQKRNRLLHGDSDRDIFSLSFLRKYITYVKHRVRPKLTDETSRFLVEAYATLRSKEDSKTLPVTARTLETMIRLSEAHAKCRLSSEVTVEDGRAAIDVMNYALYHEAAPVEAQTVAAEVAAEVIEGGDDMSADNEIEERDVLFGDANGGADDEAAGARKRAADEMDVDPDADIDDKVSKERRVGDAATAAADDAADDSGELQEGEVYVSEARRDAFRKLLVAHLDERGEPNAEFADVLSAVNAARRASRELLYTAAEARFVLQQLDNEGAVMFSEDTVYLV